MLKLGCLPAVESRSPPLNHYNDCMKTIFSQNSESVTSGLKRVRVTSAVKVGTLVTMFLLLIVGNVLSLTHQASHDRGFLLLKSILEWVTPKDVAVAMLSRSPTVTRKQEIDKATQDLKAERDAIEEKHSKLYSDHKTLSDNHKKLDDDHKKLDAAHTQLHQQERQRAAVVHKVVHRVGIRQARSAARNVASAPGKTIPVVGAALVAGATAWDIYEACELLKELDQLTTFFGNSSIQNQSQKVCGLPIPTKATLLQVVQGNWQDAYRTAAGELQGIPRVSVPTDPQVPSWTQVKGSVCSITGAVHGICP